MRTLLAVSPHLDDAVFSAGALLARRVREGWRVVIATCFTASVANPRGFALACQIDKGLGADVDYMALRRGEDLGACALLGCEAVHLPFAEAPHRGYENAAALFGGHVPGDAVAEPLSAALACQIDKGLGADVDYMSLRRGEDLGACALLGCEAAHLPFAEAPHRGYENAAALFGGHVPGDLVAEPLSAALEGLVHALDPDLVVGPAAVGRHIDHVIVRAAVERLVAPSILLWADLPYAARTAIDRDGFAAVPCADMLPPKLAASSRYASQLAFQLKSDKLDDVLQIDGAELFSPRGS